MSQGIYSNIDPNVTTGLMLAGLLNDFKDAYVSGYSGVSRPARLQAGGMWVDTSQQEAPNYYWTLKIYNGTVDIDILRISVLTGTSGFNTAFSEFTIRKISADVVAPILNLVKNRIAGGGQVLSGDTLAELRMTGRTDTSTDPIVAYIRATASENESATNLGTTLSLVSVPVGTSQLVEYLKFLSETVEIVAPHKINSWIFVSDAVPTAASILMNSDKIVSELTGSIQTVIHGIDTSGTKVKYIHNRSTAEVTIKNNSLTAGATERFSLPESEDLLLLPNCSAAFFYCATDTKWKYISGSIAGVRSFIYNFVSGYSEWVAPFTGNVRVATFEEPTTEPTSTSSASAFSKVAIRNVTSWGLNNRGQLGVGDTNPRSVPVLVVGGIQFKDALVSDNNGAGITTGELAYAWGLNDHGQLGLGDVTPRSSPVAVLGGLTFTRVDIGDSSFGIRYSGQAYAWGNNANGQLGVGDVLPRSSPVAVLGGLKISSIFHGADGEGSTYFVERDAGALYACGENANGQLGVGDVTPRSSPVAVLGGLKFRKVSVGKDCAIGLTESGLAYGWGINSDGQLGVGNVVPRSSPVAVLGGLVFKDVFSMGEGAAVSFFGLTENDDLYAWGDNDHGQLGVGDVLPRSSPVAVLGGLKWESVARLSYGTRSIVAIQRGTGSAYAWGVNTVGQLGLGDTTPRSSPVAVVGGLKFSDIHMGKQFAYGGTSERVFYAWGLNDFGQLGDNSIVNKSSPVAVQGLTESFFEAPTTKVIPVVVGQTYKIKLGGGASFFGSTYIGKNVRRAVVAFDN